MNNKYIFKCIIILIICLVNYIHTYMYILCNVILGYCIRKIKRCEKNQMYLKTYNNKEFRSVIEHIFGQSFNWRFGGFSTQNISILWILFSFPNSCTCFKLCILALKFGKSASFLSEFRPLCTELTMVFFQVNSCKNKKSFCC